MVNQVKAFLAENVNKQVVVSTAVGVMAAGAVVWGLKSTGVGIAADVARIAEGKK